MALAAKPARSSLLRRIRLKTDAVLAAFFASSLATYTVLFIVPLLAIFAYAVLFDWSTFTSQFYFNPFSSSIPFIEIRQLPTGTLFIHVRGGDYGVILNSLLDAIVVTLMAAIIGTAIAITIGVFDFPGRRIIAALAAIPLLIAPFVNSYVVLRLFGPGLQDNVATFVLKSLGLNVKLAFSDLAGVALAQTLAFYPIVYINVLAALGALDSTLVEQALNLGSRGFRLIRTIILPLVVPGILAGSTLVFILSLEDIAAPIIFKYYNMMSIQVYQFFQARSPASEAVVEVAALSLLMLLFAAVPLVVIRRYLSLRYYAKLARGAPRPLRRLPLGWLGKIVVYLVILPLVVVAAAPQIGVIVLSFSTRWTGTLPQGFTLANFVTVFTNEGILRTITNSVIYASSAAVLIALLGFVTGYSVARSRLPGTSLLDALASLPLAVPGLVVAFSYLVFFQTIAKGTVFDPFIVPGTVLVIAYTIRKSPFTVRSVFTGVIQTPEELEEAAFSLGSGRLSVLRRITMPLVWRSIAAGLMLSTIYVLSEVSVSVTIGALGGDLASTTCAGPITFAILQLVTMTAVHGGTQPQAQAAALAVILMAIEAVVMFIAASRLARRGQALVTV